MPSSRSFMSAVRVACRRLLATLWVGCVAWSALPAAAQGTAAPAAELAPDALVLAVSSDVLEAIKKDKSLAGDVDRLQALVDERILPYVNFARMTQLAVGPGWRRASAEQRKELIREFRTLLVRTYSGAVSLVKDHQVKLQPFRSGPDDRQVIVRTQVVPSSGDSIQLDYRLEKTDAGWKIFDVNILGVWLVENYRSEFASRVSQEGIDGLIRSLVERNKAASAAGAAKPK